MNVKKCYEQLEGDYKGILFRLSNDEAIIRFLKKFLKDETFSNLKKELYLNNREKSFLYVHALKGICSNMGFLKLLKKCSDLTENIRSESSEITVTTKELFDIVEQEYNHTILTIKETVESE